MSTIRAVRSSPSARLHVERLMVMSTGLPARAIRLNQAVLDMHGTVPPDGRLSPLRHTGQSPVPIASANGVELYYEETGNPADPTVLLIMGLGTQLIAWPHPFVEGLAARGFH